MIILDWLKQYLEIKYELRDARREEHICQSCETLKMQLSIANQEKKQLLDRILQPPSIETPIDTSELKPITRGSVFNWKVRQQMLEREDKERAKLLHMKEEELKQPNSISIEALEKELGVAEQEREGKVNASS